MLVSNTSSSSIYFTEKTDPFVQQAKEEQQASQDQMLTSMSDSPSNSTSSKASALHKNMDEFMEEMVKQLPENDQDAYKAIKKLREQQEKERKENNCFSSTKKSTKKNPYALRPNYNSSGMLHRLASTKTRTGVHGVINSARQSIRLAKSSSSSTTEMQATVRKLKRVVQFAEKKLTALRHEERLKQHKEAAQAAENRREERKAIQETRKRKRIRKAYERCNTIDPEDMMHNAKNEHIDSNNVQDSSISVPIVPDVASITNSMSIISAASTCAAQSAELISAAGITPSISLDVLA